MAMETSIDPRPNIQKRSGKPVVLKRGRKIIHNYPVEKNHVLLYSSRGKDPWNPIDIEWMQ